MDIKDFKEIKQILASMNELINNWPQPVTTKNTTQENLSKIDSPAPENNPKGFDNMQEYMKKMTACMYAMADQLSQHQSRLEYHRDRMDSHNERINGCVANLEEHKNDGHIPPIKGADKMNKALKILGMDGDYAAEKKTVYASENLFEIKKG